MLEKKIKVFVKYRSHVHSREVIKKIRQYAVTDHRQFSTVAITNTNQLKGQVHANFCFLVVPVIGYQYWR